MDVHFVSVIVPTFNRADILERCISGVLQQTVSEIKLIVVDDGSTDHTKDIIASINDQRLVYVALERNQGAAHARNVGLSLVDSDFVAFLDSDDVWLPTWVEKQLDAFSRLDRNYAAVACGVSRVFNDHQAVTSIPTLSGDIFQDIIEKGHTGIVNNPSSVLIRTSVVKEVGGWDESLPSAQDTDLWLRIFEHYRLGVNPEVLVRVYMNRSDRIGRDYKRLVQGQILLLKKHWSIFSWKRRLHLLRAISLAALRHTKSQFLRKVTLLFS